MAIGTYRSPERVERDGWLVAFEGEVMTMDEAVKRDLVPKAKAESQSKQPAKRASKKTGK